MYTYEKLKFTKVPVRRNTEPTIQKLFDAVKLRAEREKSFSGNSLNIEDEEDYLDSITNELKLRSQGLKEQIYEIGKLLCEAKKILGHGKLKPWIKENFTFNYKTAYNAMKVYRACMGHPEFVQYFNSSCLYVLCSPNFPTDLRQALFDGVKGHVDIKVKDLAKLALDYKNGKIKIKDKVIQDMLKKHMDISLWENYVIELKRLNQLIAKGLERIEDLTEIESVNPLITEFNKED